METQSLARSPRLDADADGARWGNVTAVRRLLVEATVSDRHSPLPFPANYGDIATAEPLLARGASINAVGPSTTTTPLMLADGG
jgi:hypothetical protein